MATNDQQNSETEHWSRLPDTSYHYTRRNGTEEWVYDECRPYINKRLPLLQYWKFRIWVVVTVVLHGYAAKYVDGWEQHVVNVALWIALFTFIDLIVEQKIKRK